MDSGSPSGSPPVPMHLPRCSSCSISITWEWVVVSSGVLPASSPPALPPPLSPLLPLDSYTPNFLAHLRSPPSSPQVVHPNMHHSHSLLSQLSFYPPPFLHLFLHPAQPCP